MPSTSPLLKNSGPTAAWKRVRWRASTGERRQQLKWLLVGAVATVVILGLGLLVPQPAGQVVAALAAIPLPAACAVAALRYRLWDVDLVLSVGLRYAILSAVVAAVYLAVGLSQDHWPVSYFGLTVFLFSASAMLVYPTAGAWALGAGAVLYLIAVRSARTR